MKKKTKKLLLLLAFFAVLVVGYLALDFIPEKTETEGETISETVEVTEFEAEDIAFYCYSNTEYEMGFTITEEGYVHYKEEKFPVSTSSVEEQLDAIGTLTALRTIDSTDKAEYGLDTPVITVAVTLKDGTERTLFFGDSALFEEGYYLLDVENSIIYLTDTSLYSKLTCSWSDMVQQEEKVLVSSEQILDVTVNTDGVQTLYISYDETKEQPWQLTTSEGTFAGDSDAVVSALGAYNSYSLMSTMEYDCVDFSVYGLEEPKTTVTVRYTEESETKSLVFEFGNTEESNNVSYVRVNGSSYVYSMSQYYTESVSVFDLETLKYVSQESTEVTE